MVLSRRPLDLSYMPKIREIEDDVLTMWISLSLNDIAFEGVVLIFSGSARNFAVEHDDDDLYIMPMWRLCVKFRHQTIFSVTYDNDQAGQVQSELSARGTKQGIENTPKCTRANCILARLSCLGPPPEKRHKT